MSIRNPSTACRTSRSLPAACGRCGFEAWGASGAPSTRSDDPARELQKRVKPAAAFRAARAGVRGLPSPPLGRWAAGGLKWPKARVWEGHPPIRTFDVRRGGRQAVRHSPIHWGVTDPRHPHSFSGFRQTIPHDAQMPRPSRLAGMIILSATGWHLTRDRVHYPARSRKTLIHLIPPFSQPEGGHHACSRHPRAAMAAPIADTCSNRTGSGAQQGKPNRPAARLAQEAFTARKEMTTHSGPGCE